MIASQREILGGRNATHRCSAFRLLIEEGAARSAETQEESVTFLGIVQYGRSSYVPHFIRTTGLGRPKGGESRAGEVRGFGGGSLLNESGRLVQA